MADIKKIAGGLYVYTTPLETLNWSNHVFFETKKLGVVVYDVPVLSKDGKSLWEQIKKYTSGKISLFIISHGHPDHWMSLDFFRTVAPKAPILAAKVTAQYIHIMGEANLRWCKMVGNLAAGVASRVIEPTKTFDKKKIIDAGDFTLELYATGPADDMEHTVVYIPELKVLLGNDVIYNKWHPWNDMERDGHWLKIIEWMRTLDAKTIVPGHGYVCGPEIYDVLEKWLTTYQKLRLKYGGKYSLKDIPPAKRKKMMAELRGAFPGWYDYELEYSCFETLALPYPYGKNKHSVTKL